MITSVVGDMRGVFEGRKSAFWPGNEWEKSGRKVERGWKVSKKSEKRCKNDIEMTSEGHQKVIKKIPNDTKMTSK